MKDRGSLAVVGAAVLSSDDSIQVKRMSEKGSLQRSNQGFSDDDSTAASRFLPLFSTSQTSSKNVAAKNKNVHQRALLMRNLPSP